MNATETVPTSEELIGAIDDLFYAAHQSAFYVYWKLVEGPITSSFEQHGIPQARTYFNNGIIESSLLLIRKTAEFFKPREDRDRPDTLYAYRYLPRSTGIWIIPKDIYTELHKRVGHMTIREARYGKQVWQIVDLTAQAVDQWIAFFSGVVESPLFNGNPPKEKLNRFVSSLGGVSRACHLLQSRAKTWTLDEALRQTAPRQG